MIAVLLLLPALLLAVLVLMQAVEDWLGADGVPASEREQEVPGTSTTDITRVG